MDEEKSEIPRPLLQHRADFDAWAQKFGYGASGRIGTDEGESKLKKLCAKGNPFARTYRDNRGKPPAPVEPDKSILKPPVLRRQLFAGYGFRITNCHKCNKFPLDSLTDPDCGTCGWLLCSCGGCGCNYPWRR